MHRGALACLATVALSARLASALPVATYAIEITDTFVTAPSQGQLGVTLTIAGASRYCMTFGGTIVKDVVGRFQAKNAAAPDACVTTP
jgi:hypothetical protein